MPLELRPGPLATGALVSRARRPKLGTRIGLAVLVAVVAGLASAGLIAAQRADTSVDRFVDWYRPEDRIVVTAPGVSPRDALGLLRTTGRRPEVADRLLLSVIVVRAHLPGGDPARGAMVAEAPLNRPPSDMARFRMLRGGPADPRRPDETVIDEDLAGLLHAGVGDRIEVDLYPADKIDVIGNGRATAPRATVALRVTGVIRRPQDLEHDPESQPDNLGEFNDAFLETTPAFWSKYGPDLANYGFHELVRLKPNATARRRFIASFAGRRDTTSFPADVFHDTKVVHRAVRTEA
ncbi:MAG: hypothetical protein JO291_02130, partial [Acidimicrobiia bacterium]|nr:hypothetical protein [Acidimicrobiia bacterium]